MSESRPPIGPPPPRRTSEVKNLVKSNRASTPQTPDSPQVTEPAANTVPAIGKKQVTFYIEGADRQRAKAAYKATSSQEDHGSWSDFVARALMNEVLRLESSYNDGKPFPGGNANLTPGRRLGPY
jgi:hypothetical protein